MVYLLAKQVLQTITDAKQVSNGNLEEWKDQEWRLIYFWGCKCNPNYKKCNPNSCKCSPNFGEDNLLV